MLLLFSGYVDALEFFFVQLPAQVTAVNDICFLITMFVTVLDVTRVDYQHLPAIVQHLTGCPKATAANLKGHADLVLREVFRNVLQQSIR